MTRVSGRDVADPSRDGTPERPEHEARAAMTISGPGLEPLLRAGLRVIVVGFNPSIRAHQTGHYYAGRANRFYTLLYTAKLTPRLLRPVEDALLLEFGIGVMDLSSIPSARAHELKRETFSSGADLVKKTVSQLAPTAVCCNGYGVFTALTGTKPTRAGLQPGAAIARASVFAVPSSSGAASAFTAERHAGWLELGEFLGADVNASSPGGTLASRGL